MKCVYFGCVRSISDHVHGMQARSEAGACADPRGGPAAAAEEPGEAARQPGQLLQHWHLQLAVPPQVRRPASIPEACHPLSYAMHLSLVSRAMPCIASFISEVLLEHRRHCPLACFSELQGCLIELVTDKGVMMKVPQ